MIEEIKISEGFGKYPPAKKAEAAIKEVWEKEVKKPEPKKEEKIVTADFDLWKLTCGILAVLTLVFFFGYVSKDTFIQDRIETIQRAEGEINKAEKKIEENKKTIEKAKTELQTRKITYR